MKRPFCILEEWSQIAGSLVVSQLAMSHAEHFGSPNVRASDWSVM
jgi:hypothetical protein